MTYIYSGLKIPFLQLAKLYFEKKENVSFLILKFYNPNIVKKLIKYIYLNIFKYETADWSGTMKVFF